MNRLILLLIIVMGCATTVSAHDQATVERYQREAEYYERQSESYMRDAEYYLRQAKSHQSDAAYYLKNKNYDRARDYYKRAADAMDNYEYKLNYAKNSASRAEDYLKRAAEACR